MAAEIQLLYRKPAPKRVRISIFGGFTQSKRRLFCPRLLHSLSLFLLAMLPPLFFIQQRWIAIIWGDPKNSSRKLWCKSYRDSDLYLSLVIGGGWLLRDVKFLLTTRSLTTSTYSVVKKQSWLCCTIPRTFYNHSSKESIEPASSQYIIMVHDGRDFHDKRVLLV